MFFHDKFLLSKYIKTTSIDTLYYFVVYLYLSFLSPYLSTLGWTEFMKGWFFASFSFVTIFFAPVIGTLSDKIGRFKIMRIGIFLEIVALTGYVLFDQTVVLFVLRVLSAVAFNSVVLVALSRIHDTIGNKNSHGSQLTGIFHSILSISSIIAPLIGGFVADIKGYNSLFIVSLVAMVLVFIGLTVYDLFFYNDNRPHRKKESFKKSDLNPFSDLRDILKFKKLKAASLLGVAANFAVPFGTLVLPFLVIQKMGLSNFQLSIVFFIIGIAHLFQFAFGKLGDKIGSGKCLISGLLIVVIGFIILFFAKSYWFLLVAVLIKAIGNSMFNVSAWAFMSEIGEEHNIEGKVVGGYSSISRISMFVSFIVSGAILVKWETGIFLLYGGLLFIAILLTHRTITSSSTA